MTYVILDTNILVSALWRNLRAGKPARLLQQCMAGYYQVVYTRDIFEEYREVLARPKFSFMADDIAGILDFFRFRALPADPLFESLSRPQCPDPYDQMFYDAACCWDAVLVTGNIKDFPADQRVMTIDEFMEHRDLPGSAILEKIDR